MGHRSWTREWHTTLPSNQTKNNKQEELARRSWKQGPHSQLCLWSFTSVFNTDVVLFLPSDLSAVPCRWWRSESHCCAACSLGMKKGIVNEWNKMSNPFRFFKNKSRQTRYRILPGFVCWETELIVSIKCILSKEKKTPPGTDLQIKICMMCAVSRWYRYISF